MFTARRHEIVTYSGKHNDRLGEPHSQSENEKIVGKGEEKKEI